MVLERALSTLELTALGVVLKRGPCVAHAVVKEFAGSRTKQYHSGAGSVYPLMKRLTDAGLLAVDANKYSITDLGKRALADWLEAPLSKSDFHCGLDELRSRFYFFKLIETDSALSFIVQGLEGLRDLLEYCNLTVEGYRASGDRFSELAMRGAVLETEARIQWMCEIRDELMKMSK